MMPPTSTSSPSQHASTSTSIATSRKRSSSTGLSFDTLTAVFMYVRRSSSLNTTSIARPPSTYDGRTTSGNPTVRASTTACSSVRAVALAGCLRPRFFTSTWKRSRSSAMSIESGDVPMIGAPAASSARDSLSGVWPPYCTITPSGCSFAMISSTSSSVSGSK
jgi:hypothetical protein